MVFRPYLTRICFIDTNAPTEQTSRQEQGWQYLRCFSMWSLLAEGYMKEEK